MRPMRSCPREIARSWLTTGRRTSGGTQANTETRVRTWGAAAARAIRRGRPVKPAVAVSLAEIFAEWLGKP